MRQTHSILTLGLIALMGLSACAGTPVPGRDVDGTEEPTILFQQPLCLVLCWSSIQTTGSDVDTIGTNTNTNTTQNPNAQLGGINQ